MIVKLRDTKMVLGGSGMVAKKRISQLKPTLARVFDLSKSNPHTFGVGLQALPPKVCGLDIERSKTIASGCLSGQPGSYVFQPDPPCTILVLAT